MSKRQRAFSLIELMVVVGIMMVVTTIGIASYVNTQDRTSVSNTAKALLVYFRKLQSYAKNGDRGPLTPSHPCASDRNIAAGEAKLERWQANLTTTTPPQAKAEIVCYDQARSRRTTYQVPLSNSNYDPSGQKYTYNFPKSGDLKLTAKPTGLESGCSGFIDVGCVLFEGVFGETSVSENCTGDLYDLTGVTPRCRNAQFIVDDGRFYYTFYLDNGAFSSGCVCEDSNCREKC
jgi:type II secretory pathway pseudopilin PulG